jgi:hypothetical protein
MDQYQEMDMNEFEQRSELQALGRNRAKTRYQAKLTGWHFFFFVLYKKKELNEKVKSTFELIDDMLITMNIIRFPKPLEGEKIWNFRSFFLN